MIGLLRLWYWQYRLRLARQYRANVERVMRMEVLKAQHDLEHCTAHVKEAHIARVTRRANRALAGKP